MSDDEIIQDVRAWLSRNGYVLEMEVAQALLPHCSMVQQGHWYRDPMTGKPRETDIFCTWFHSDEATHHIIEMVIECKNTTSPWIVFFGGSEGTNDSLFPYQIIGRPNCARCDDMDDFYKLGPGGRAPIAYSITEKKNAKGDKDLAHDAVAAVTSAALGSLREVETDNSKSQMHYSYRVFPIVVTRSPIVACSLDDTGEVALSRIESCWLSSVHEVRTNELPTRSLVISYSAFRKFVEDFAVTCNRLGLQ